MKTFIPLFATALFVWPTIVNANAPLAKNSAPLQLTSLATENRDSVPYDALRTFVDVFDAIKKNYAQRVSNQTLMNAAIRGMLTELDPGAHYFNEEQYRIAEGEEDGIAAQGIILDDHDPHNILAVLPHSPAARAGILAQDHIKSIDGLNAATLKNNQIFKALQGTPGKNLTIVVTRLEQTLQRTWRSEAPTRSLSSTLLAPHFAHLTIANFRATTADELLSFLKKNKGIEGIILDLRGTQGGDFSSAIDCANLFISKGILAQLRGVDSRQPFEAENGAENETVPLVVLVDAQTAGAAEIFAAALHDHHRALLIGQKTKGEGRAQNFVALSTGGAIRITTGYYLTPQGQEIEKKGLVPDIELKEEALRRESGKDWGITHAQNALRALIVGKKMAAIKPK